MASTEDSTVEAMSESASEFRSSLFARSQTADEDTPEPASHGADSYRQVLGTPSPPPRGA